MRIRTIAVIAIPLLVFSAIVNAAVEETLRSVDPKDGWKFATKSNDVAIYSRVRAGSSLKEFKAVGGIDAPTRAVHAVIDDVDSYPSFMPYTAECRLIKRDGDTIITYQRLSPKICADRDYTLRISKKSWPAADGTAYMNRWSPANEFGPPEKKGAVRVKTCEGSWLLEPDGPGKTRATYSVYTDTAGAIPAFLANHASQIGIGKLFAAVIRKRYWKQFWKRHHLHVYNPSGL